MPQRVKSKILRHSRWVSLRHQNYTSGWPTGAVLSPLLCTVYVADIPSSKPVHMAQFADDTCIFYQYQLRKLPRSTTVLQEALNEICNWFARWNIKISANKTEAIIFTKTGRRLQIPKNIKNHWISYSSSVKYFGLTLDSKLTFQKHVSNLKQKFYRALAILYPFFKCNTLSQRIKITLYVICSFNLQHAIIRIWSLEHSCQMP